MAASIVGATIRDLQVLMDSGEATSGEVVEAYVQRYETVDVTGPTLRSIIEINPDADRLAAELDEERRRQGPRGPLHGIPVLLKDNIDTADDMMTTAGSLALAGARRERDAFVARRLREAGAVLLGKANMSEWANFRSDRSSSGWSGRGGQCRNPYALDRSPCGSSSGSAAAVAASLAPISLGTETDGSILCPGGSCGVVGVKPTVGLTSRAGVVPISHSQDTVGPFACTVADAATVLTAIAGPDGRDPATAASAGHVVDYLAVLKVDALRGARIGVAREGFFEFSDKSDRVMEMALQVLRDAGAELIDPANLPSMGAIRDMDEEIEVLLYEFKADLNAYLGALGPESPVHSLDDVITFNEDHAAEELTYFGQEMFLRAREKGALDEPAYLKALETCRRLGGAEGIDAVMEEHRLDALVAPTGAPAFKIDLIDGDHHLGGSSRPAAIAGYPAVTVPAGYTFGLPVGITFMGRPWSEARLLALAHSFERAAGVWQLPQYLPAT